jgi:hypothetical protein
MKTHLTSRWFAAWALVAAPLVLCAAAQDTRVGTPPAAPTATGMKRGDSATPAAAADKAALSAGIEEILKMVDAGVSKEVIKAYVENSPIAYNPNAADLIALKERAVTDDITTVLVKRGAEVRAQASQASASAAVAQASTGAASPNAAAPAYADNNPGYATLDPESYDFWWYYYAYPRTLAYANQRVFSGYPGFSYSAPYYYSSYRSLPFRPYSPAAFSHPRNFGVRGGVSPLNRNGALQPSPGFGGPPFGQRR